MKNYSDRGGCYPRKPKAEADNTLWDLHNSSYHTKAEFNNSKYFQSSKNIQFFLIEFCWVHGKIARHLKIKSKRKMTNKTLFKEVTNLPLEAKYE